MKECIFCDPKYRKEHIVMANDLFFAMFDANPVSKGHMMVIPIKHITSFFDLRENELIAAFELLGQAKDMVDKKFKPDDYNIGVNDGKAAGQTIPHLHIHLIPRYFGDVADPTGGVRYVIPEKGNYLKNKK